MSEKSDRIVKRVWNEDKVEIVVGFISCSWHLHKVPFSIYISFPFFHHNCRRFVLFLLFFSTSCENFSHPRLFFIFFIVETFFCNCLTASIYSCSHANTPYLHHLISLSVFAYDDNCSRWREEWKFSHNRSTLLSNLYTQHFVSLSA